MKKIILITLTLLPLIGCIESNKNKELQTLLSGADFPCVVTEITDYSQSNGYRGRYSIKGKRLDGTTNNFTSNVKYAIGDTITIGVDTTHEWSKILDLSITRVVDTTKGDSIIINN